MSATDLSTISVVVPLTSPHSKLPEWVEDIVTRVARAREFAYLTFRIAESTWLTNMTTPFASMIACSKTSTTDFWTVSVFDNVLVVIVQLITSAATSRTWMSAIKANPARERALEAL